MEDPGASSTFLDELPLGVGSDVGGYTIDGVLGEGGMGVVYAATHPVIGKRAAIKVLKAALSSNHQAVERFVGEARAVNAIGHPNIVDIFAFGALPDGRSYYVMDLLVGETLRARLRRGPMHISEAASVIDETASALIAAHATAIIHRDLKPDNVYMVQIAGRWPEVKLLDWGLAKLSPWIAGKTRTLAGQVLGTPVYMSPEQARGGEIDHRTDIYALGVMSYELLAGTVPFRKGSSLDTMVAHQEDPVPPLLQRVPNLPEELAQLIEAMLAKGPDERPTLAAVRAVLKRLRGTKIPTMTAAGLQLSLGRLEPRFDPNEAKTNPFSGRDIAVSEQLTNPRLRASPARMPMAAPPEPPMAGPPPEATSLPPMARPAPSPSPSPLTTLPSRSPPPPSAPPPRATTPAQFPAHSQHSEHEMPAARSRLWVWLLLVALALAAAGVALAVAH